MRLGVAAALVDGSFRPGDVEVEAGLVTAVGLAGPGHGVAVPGFVDLQVNGFGGVDFPQPDGPTRIMNSPSPMSRSMALTASVPSG